MKDTIVAQATPIGRGGVGIFTGFRPTSQQGRRSGARQNLNAENGKLLAI